MEAGGGHIFGVDFHNMNETRRRFEANQTSFDSLTTNVFEDFEGKANEIGSVNVFEPQA